MLSFLKFNDQTTRNSLNPVDQSQTTAKRALPATPADRLGLTTFFATVVHAIVIFGVGFSLNMQFEPTPQSLDVVLLQTESAEAPQEAKHIAQSNQLASGSATVENNPSRPVTGPSPLPTPGLAPLAAQATPTAEPKPIEDRLLTRDESQTERYTDKQQQREQRIKPSDPQPQSQRALEIAQLTAELAEKDRRYALRPRINYVDTLSAKTAVEAAYLKAWVETVERLGNLNYPDEARRKALSGSLILHVLLNYDGSVVRVKVSSPSGQQVLDDAAKRIVQLASPFKPFPEQMHETYDQLMITRTWVFQARNSLITR